ncbi:MAG: histidinol-phosphate transaminase [Bacteroidetes bacterium]|nr:histidinol-phosphate transaminase [Bacteroidota bacterium]
MFDLNKIIRSNIKALTPYSSARDEFSGQASIYLDANENPFNTGFNRYPDPMQWTVKEKIAAIKKVKKENILLGNGSDEVIDLLLRAFCEPKENNIITFPPTYGMYEVYGNINSVEIKKVSLTVDFQIDVASTLKAIDAQTKLIFVCSPNNPTGGSINPDDVKQLLKNFEGIVVIDEAYADFATQESWVNYLDMYPNLFVMQTFSKAWGLAALRLGVGYASPEIIKVLNKIKPPYNINELTQQAVLKKLESYADVQKEIEILNKEREALSAQLSNLPLVQKVYPSDANFILAKVNDANKTYNYLVEKGIIVRNRNTVTLCEGCIRITVGTAEENKEVINALKNFEC